MIPGSHTTLRLFSALLGLLALWPSARLPAENVPAAPGPPPGLTARDYSYGYWLNGWRKHAEDPAPDLLCFESGYFGFTLDPAALGQPRFARFANPTGYVRCLDASTARLSALAPAELRIELETGGKTYRMTTCHAGTSREPRRLETVRLWESGKWVQHYDVQRLVFQDDSGANLDCDGTLDLVAWPGSLTFHTELAPCPAYRNGPNEGVSGTGFCVADQPFDVPHQPAIDPAILTVECWVKIPEAFAAQLPGWLLCKNRNELQDGNFGFLLRGRSELGATLNIGGGSANRWMIEGPRALLPGGWHHLALSYDGKTMVFYVDGSPRGQQLVDKPRTPGSERLRIGKRGDNHGTPVKALYDQVRIWNRALSPAEIREHARQPQTVGVRDGLVFEENFEKLPGAPFAVPAWTDARLRARFQSGAETWQAEAHVPGAWKMGEKHGVTLNCDLEPSYRVAKEVQVRVETADGQSFPTAVDPSRNCHGAAIRGLKREWKTGMRDIRNYDDLIICLDNPAEETRMVSLLVDLSGTANITGLCPVLCDEAGVPTGIPVQLSKNWHDPRTGEYLRACLRIPAKPGVQRVLLRVIYGFFGTVPSASHAQLCLVGYGGNARWDQLAIGCWGETFCLDPDMSLVDVAITDTRCLMVRKGADGPGWNWTDGGWGGDWLGVFRQDGKLPFAGMKVAYLAHGPCLTDVRYRGRYGANGDADVQATVHTLRTDDYARTFHRLRYTFRETLSAKDSWLFKMGRTSHLVTPRVAYGNRDGLVAERDVPASLNPGETFLQPTTLPGAGPWWVAFPGGFHPESRLPDGSRALILRSYCATFGGKTYRQPTIRMPLFSERNADLLVVPPGEIAEYKPGDAVELDVEWITLPRTAEDYYGPNENFRQHLAENPCSWKTVYREARGNDLQVQVEGGTLLSPYPIRIRARQAEVRVAIRGGVGFVPVRFEDLKTPTGWAVYRTEGGKETRLDQAVHGNDFWQADSVPGSGTYQITFNLPLDGQENSAWIFRPEKKS